MLLKHSDHVAARDLPYLTPSPSSHELPSKKLTDGDAGAFCRSVAGNKGLRNRLDGAFCPLRFCHALSGLSPSRVETCRQFCKGRPRPLLQQPG